MKTFNNLEEMQPYYNKKTNTYEFIENQKMIDVEFDFNLKIYRNIKARNIKAEDINACNIDAWNINARDINACNINACNINAGDINAGDINAGDIEFYAVCFAYKTFVCDSIKGTHKNSKYFCLDSDVIINKKED